MTAPLEYDVVASRIDAHGGLATARQAQIRLDTDPAGQAGAFNPAELLLAATAACMLKGAERVAPMIGFDLRGMEVRVHATRRDNPPRIVSIEYDILVDTPEDDRRLELLHTNIRKYGTVSNTLADAVALSGTIRRR